MFSFSYKKEDGIKELEKPKEQNSIGIPQIILCDNHNPSSYEKDDGQISPKLILALSGGTAREKKHLKILQDSIFHSCLKFIFIADDKAKPQWMCSYWKSLNGEIEVDNQKMKLTSIDDVFFITDVDEFGFDLKNLIQQGEPQNVQWIISNPCIEIWLYYCYFDNPNKDLSDLVPLSEKDRSQWLKKKLPQLKRGGIDPRKAFDNVKIGIINARNNYAEDANTHIPTLFSTQMYIFAQTIFETIEKPFEELQTHRQEEIQQFKQQIINSCGM